jgi:hypothetical protein
MRLLKATSVGIVATGIAFFVGNAPGQDAPKEAEVHEIKGMPPRVAPTEYNAHAKAGRYTIAAEFTRHSVAMPDQTLSTEDYVVVDVGFFGPPDAHLVLNHEDFSLRINEKKAPLPSQVYGVIFHSLKDPEWSPPESASSKSSKTSIGTGSGEGGGQSNDPPPVIHMPIELERAMQLRVKKSALPEGDRPLPAAGLLFFPYRGRAEGIHSVELMYTGPAGKTVLDLHP